jgi:hypothetical protein
MHGDAERAVVSVGVDLVNVRHLNDGEQREQEQAHEGWHRQSSQLCAALSAPRCLKVCQRACPYFLLPCFEDTHYWMRPSSKCYV